ncbi:hypothetical protein B7494_g2391 [Chlorociboria aeruginascens]|nr:hypothetical protein B7494_g2391 [Chlorociboria aeruginascens]
MAGRPLYKQVTNSSPDTNHRGFLVRKNYVFLGVIFASAFAFEIGFDKTADKLWDASNKGRQWKDIRAKYVEAADDDE